MELVLAFLQNDVTGWSAFGGLCVLLVLAFFTETVVPGRSHRRLLALLEKNAATLGLSVDQNGELIKSNELTNYVVGQLDVKRSEGSK